MSSRKARRRSRLTAKSTWSGASSVASCSLVTSRRRRSRRLTASSVSPSSLPDAGHLPQEETPEQVLEVLGGFLDGVPGGTDPRHDGAAVPVSRQA
jgi:hypothetical protein